MTFSLETPAARLVRQEKPATASARARAWMTSSTVDIPRVGAECLEHPNFSHCFVLRAHRARVNAFVQDDVDLECALAKFFAQSRRVSVGQIEKLGRPDQRRCSGEIDVIGYHHPFARFEFWIERAGGVGDDQLLDSGFGDYANNRCDFAR